MTEWIEVKNERSRDRPTASLFPPLYVTVAFLAQTMTSRKGRRQNNHNPVNLTDYESDAAYYSDMPQQPAPALRSNEELNLSVIRRHKPSVVNILSLAHYVVVYIINPSTNQWEKNGVEGSLFVCQETQGELGEHRYTAFVLNRRGPTNFDLPLTNGENVEITDEFVIIKADNPAEGETGAHGAAEPRHPPNAPTNQESADNLRIYGLWIYCEPPPNSSADNRTINAKMIEDCAVHAGHSMKLAREHLEAMRQNSLHAAAAAAANQVAPLEEVQASVPMGRQISLKDLFGQQRAQDDGWSVRAHQLAPQQYAPPQLHQSYGVMMPPNVYSHPQQPPPQPQTDPDVLGALFRKAGLAHQGPPQGHGH
ncbi:Dcp1-like decapping [Penicillium brevicompactum]|uniref:Dcp1-like decapping n=2 Tax=Penicillium brevicompactum TaxID=5074 RepID=A0A9W9U7M3_PENBR|nr:Dcp1-like decapping [Penicillium brevicompactum]